MLEFEAGCGGTVSFSVHLVLNSDGLTLSPRAFRGADVLVAVFGVDAAQVSGSCYSQDRISTPAESALHSEGRRCIRPLELIKENSSLDACRNDVITPDGKCSGKTDLDPSSPLAAAHARLTRVIFLSKDLV